MRYVATLTDLRGPPWRHDSELALIRDWFYPQHSKQDAYLAPQPDMRKRAISKINLYLFKAGDIPHAMVATANLTEAILHDSQPNRESYISHNAMASIYAIAFVKFVNGFVDRDVAKAVTSSLVVAQTDGLGDDETRAATPVVKGGGEVSMYAHAAKIGMPESFVDLRHEIVHGEVPELWHLREMSEKGLEWLWERWWLKNATGDSTKALKEIELKQMETERQEGREHPLEAEAEMADIG